MPKNLNHWSVIILAGGENSNEAHQETGERWEAMVSFANRHSIEYVLNACRECNITNIAIVLPEQERNRIEIFAPKEVWAKPGQSLIESLQAGLAKLDKNTPTMVLPADTPLMRKEHVMQFANAIEQRVDVSRDVFFAAGLCTKLKIQTRFPNTKYKFLRFKEGYFASGALFASSKKGIESAIKKIQPILSHRKNLLKWMFRLGAQYSFSYFTGRITLQKAENIAAKLLNGKCLLITDVDPDTTFDFDSIEEYKYLQNNFKRLRLE
jgi:GTP:adenosylcobinamide-phosphate guanylyltransferase